MESPQHGYVYVPAQNVGYAHPIKDFETIKWVYDVFLRRYSKSFRTRCINDFLEQYEELLEKEEAYELLEYMRSQVTQKQRDKRKQSQAITAAKSAIWEAEFKARCEHREKEKAFLAKMRGDICLN